VQCTSILGYSLYRSNSSCTSKNIFLQTVLNELADYLSALLGTNYKYLNHFKCKTITYIETNKLCITTLEVQCIVKVQRTNIFK